MSTTSRSRPRPRRAYDVSPSPPRSRSPTLVPSRASSESTISLPHQNTARGQYAEYGQYEPHPQEVHKVQDSIAKISIVFGVVTVLAGVMQLRKSKLARRRAKLQEEHEASQRREQRRREKEQMSRSAQWPQYANYGPNSRIVAPDSGAERLRIEGPSQVRNNRDSGGGYGSEAGRSRR